MKTRLQSDPAHEGLSVVTALRDRLAGGIVGLDDAGRIAAFTPGAEQILGLPAAQVLGQPASVLPEPLQKAIRGVQESPQPLTEAIVTLPAKTGEISAHVTLVRPARAGAGLAIFLADLTSARRLEENVCRLDRLASIGTLSASMAHEIKNALVAVRTFNELLLEKNPDAELGGIMRREMERIESIVSRMLKFAMPARQSFTTVRLHALLEHSLRIVQHELDGKSIVVERNFSADNDRVMGNDYELEQAFLNLFLNAVEAMGPNGTLAVATERVALDSLAPAQPKPHLRITIRDTGVGISPESRGRIFEPFFTTKQNGTGLGLPVTHRIVQEHDGAIHLESDPGKGSTFEILLPLLAGAS